MAPIHLKSWVPRNTKPTWDWKAKGSEELAHFTVAFAIKEYVQNIVGQILKDLQVKEWADWKREDLRDTSVEDRRARKRWLIPLYILSADISIPSETNLLVAIVLWTRGSALNALSFFNNHLDDNATFESFAVDGQSTIKESKWAVGEKGKGFILATQYLAEKILATKNASPTTPDFESLAGISFRVGEQIGELKWKKTRGIESSLRLILDDLTTRTHIDEASDGGDPAHYDSTIPTAKCRDEADTILKQAASRRIKYGLDRKDAKSVVHSDEFFLAPKQNAQQNAQQKDIPRFYHRDQWVPYGPHLNRLSINYHGDLTLSSERVMVVNDWKLKSNYKRDLDKSVHLAFRVSPELAIGLAHDILRDDHSDGIAGILAPPDKDGATEYRTAFETVMRRIRSTSTALPLHPYSRLDENLPLFTQLGLEPFMVSHRALEIMQKSGAYPPVQTYARERLLASAPIPDFPGLDRVHTILRTLLPDLPSENVTVREYDNLYPAVVWDDAHKIFAFARPKPCEDHPTGTCLCWIGPALQDAADKYKGAAISGRKLWRALIVQMGGDTTIRQAAPANPKATDPPSASKPTHASTSMQSGLAPAAPTGAPPSASQLTRSGTISKTTAQSDQAPSVPNGTVSIPAVNLTLVKGGTVDIAPRTDQKPATQPAAGHTPSGPTFHPSISTTSSQPHHMMDEAALRKLGLEQVIKAFNAAAKYDQICTEVGALGQSSVDQLRCIDELRTSIRASDARSATLEIRNKRSLKRLASYQDLAEAIVKRQKMDAAEDGELGN
ncbi:hypothetical protein K438DRAFT_2020644 [Mycena galopus ATCC 62051]|nr:hypothetical protein K438DRAFT_2020644 [Mycena galopus ATCC 62051]